MPETFAKEKQEEIRKPLFMPIFQKRGQMERNEK